MVRLQSALCALPNKLCIDACQVPGSCAQPPFTRSLIFPPEWPGMFSHSPASSMETSKSHQPGDHGTDPPRGPGSGA